ncbi:MAG: response regulator [Anaerolineaceae bacterium]|nr:response regulator [Anaerolineaceae bacterium]
METSEVIRVLIVDNNGETREKVRALLKLERGMEVIAVAKTGKEAIDLAQEFEPDVVVLDVNMPDMDEIEVTEAICRRVPFSQIIILAVQVEPNYMRRAMLAGARDFLVKPPMPDELRSAVYRAGGLAHERRDNSFRVRPHPGDDAQPSKQSQTALGKVIQIYSPKGGTGCTTLATNLAMAMHTPKTKSVLVDGNLQYGDVAVFTNEVGYHSILDLTPRVDALDPEIISTVTVTHRRSGVDIIIAPNRPELADQVSGEAFYKVLQYLRRLYTYVIVDTEASLGELTLSVLDASDLVVLVVTQDIAAVKNARLFLSITDGLHVNRQRVVVVMNRYDKRVAISPERVAENLKHEIASVIPLDETIAVRAANQGLPFVIDRRNEAISRAVFDLADLVRNRLVANESVETIQIKLNNSPA